MSGDLLYEDINTPYFGSETLDDLHSAIIKRGHAETTVVVLYTISAIIVKVVGRLSSHLD